MSLFKIIYYHDPLTNQSKQEVLNKIYLQNLANRFWVANALLEVDVHVG